MADPSEPTDPIEIALTSIPLPPQQKLAIYDAIRRAPTLDEAAAALSKFPLSRDMRADIWDAKQQQLQTTGPQNTLADRASDVAGAVNDVKVGITKGVGETAYGLGKMAHDYTPLGRISDAIQPGAFDPANKPKELEATNTAQKIGKGVEQIGEFFTPTGVAGKAAKAAEIAKAIFLTKAHGGSNMASLVSGAITGVLPGAQAVNAGARRVAGSLVEGAEKNIAQGLGATKEWAKSEAADLAPGVLARKFGGTHSAMLEKATEMASRVGAQLQQAYEDAAKAGGTVAKGPVLKAIRDARKAFYAEGSEGQALLIPTAEDVVRQLTKIERFVMQLPDEIPVDKAWAVRKVWDWAVSKAGLYGQKVGANATDSAKAWATREATGSFRELINHNPTLAELNAESSFWIGLRDVLDATKLRSQAQTTGLSSTLIGGMGAVAAMATGGSVMESGASGLITGYIAKRTVQLLQSPQFRTQVAGPAKMALATALASGKAGRVFSVVNGILASLPGFSGGDKKEASADERP